MDTRPGRRERREAERQARKANINPNEQSRKASAPHLPRSRHDPTPKPDRAPLPANLFLL